MATKNLSMVAFDCSNSSIRTILGSYDGKRLDIRTLHQEENNVVKMNGIDFWDVPHIYKSMIKGLEKAVEITKIDSIGVCTWGVDFALFTKDGIMLSNPMAYRNSFGAEILSGISEEDSKELFKATGVLSDKINSAYMLCAIKNRFPELYHAGNKLLMIPDIFNYLLTGVMANEKSELSTTQLLDVKEQKISQKAFAILDLDSSLFGETVEHGSVIGYLRKDVLEQIGADYDIPVICVPSHDTASAVLAVPSAEKDFAFISSGTWALIGSETDHPLVTDPVMRVGLTNELGSFGKTTLLKNNMGMYIVQRLKEEFNQELSWDEFYELSDRYKKTEVAHFDVNSEELFNPGIMSDAVWKAIGGKGEKDFGLMIRSFLESLAESYAKCISEIEYVRKVEFKNIYVVGGGIKNARLNALTAQYTGKSVVTGSSESTSMGNFLTQIKYVEPEKSIGELRDIIIESIRTEIFREGGEIR